ncbi:hypothetical protein HERIO_780 [Hepatospora eriocheir]|uniref:Large ribosomal subunit protein eL24-related N-terminal domain-containing protein n=1 Tax=Hepatospora eriocheir TaxID=1081669 RepID=A0A1X0QC31_9MICR|nr:hypothetical protein HERIO_780 [Hepatospora eriocheir]
MYQGESSFSGVMIPKAKGITKICTDGRLQFTFGGKERNLIENKINPRIVKWTLISREFYKKSEKTSNKSTEQKLTVTKKVRGFNCVPSSLIKKSN